MHFDTWSGNLIDQSTIKLIQEYVKLEFISIIVNRGDWLLSPANIKGENKDAKIYVGRSTTVHNLLFCARTVCMSYVTKAFLLFRS